MPVVWGKQMAQRRRKKVYEFKPDPKGTNFLKKLYMTRLQRRQLLKWTTLALLCVVLLIVQDVIMSHFRLFGATTDLAVVGILLIALYEGTENGSMFALIASIIYWFSGSPPGPYVIAFLTVLAVAINLFRQMFWRRSFGSTTLCTGVAIMAYEMILFGAGMLMGKTIWSRVFVYLRTGLYSCIVMLALYPLVRAISKIGGDTWKE